MAQVGGGGVLADEADHFDLGFEADDLHGDVGGSAGHLVLVGDLQDLDGGLGAEAVGPALDVAVEHDIADDRDPTGPEGVDQGFEAGLGAVHRVGVSRSVGTLVRERKGLPDFPDSCWVRLVRGFDRGLTPAAGLLRFVWARGAGSSGRRVGFVLSAREDGGQCPPYEDHGARRDCLVCAPGSFGMRGSDRGRISSARPVGFVWRGVRVCLGAGPGFSLKEGLCCG